MGAPYPRAEVERRIIDRIERGWSLTRLQREPGFPCRNTVAVWAKADPGFAARLAAAQAWRASRNWDARQPPPYDELTARALLAAVRAGGRVRALVQEPAFPSLRTLRRWTCERPDFGEALTAAVAAGVKARGRRVRWARFDQAVADRIIVAVAYGKPMRAALADPALPCEPIVARWRRANPEFATALKAAQRIAHRNRLHARWKPSEAMVETMLGRIIGGASLRALARARDMPSRDTIYQWMQRDWRFADMIRWAERERDLGLLERAELISRGLTAANFATGAREIGEIRRRIGRMTPKGPDGEDAERDDGDWEYETGEVDEEERPDPAGKDPDGEDPEGDGPEGEDWEGDDWAL